MKKHTRHRRNRRAERKTPKCCESCDHCLPIGEGDHYCDETQELVLIEYEPSESYMCCHGKKFIER